MNNNASPREKGWQWKKIIQYLLQGVLVVAPIAITAYLIYWFVSSIDNLVPIFTTKDETGKIVIRNYGLGFVIVIVALVLIGYLSSNFLTSRIFSLFDGWLERTPGIKFIYSSIRDFFEAFAGNKKKFTKAVLVNIHSEEVWEIGFITDDDAGELGMKDYISVYVPQSYAFTGHLYIVPVRKIRVISTISAAEALKYAISGGVTDLYDEDELKKETPKPKETIA